MKSTKIRLRRLYRLPLLPRIPVLHKVGAAMRGVHAVMQAPCIAEHARHAAGTP